MARSRHTNRTHDRLFDSFPTPDYPGLYRDIPNIPIVTYNMNGASHYATDRSGMARARRVRANIKALARHAKIILLQETHLNPTEHQAFQGILPGWLAIYNNYSANKWGVVTLIHPSIHKFYEVGNVCDYGNSPGLLKGRVAITSLSSPKYPRKMYIVNMYLTTGANFRAKADEINLVMGLCPRDQFYFVGGDFNFVEDKEDSSSGSAYFTPPQKFVKCWDSFCSKLCWGSSHSPDILVFGPLRSLKKNMTVPPSPHLDLTEYTRLILKRI